MRSLIPLPSTAVGVRAGVPAPASGRRRPSARAWGRASRAFLATVALLPTLLAAVGPVPARADVYPQTMNGVPLLPIPTYEEVGLPPFTMPTGTPSSGADAPSGDTGAPGDGEAAGGDGADSTAMQTMMGRSWGEAASQYAEQVGVTPVSVAATCTMESRCSSNPASSGTISGTFQMRDDTYLAMIASAQQRNPSLAAVIVPGLAGKLDPATQSIAAAEYLRQGAVALQSDNIPNPDNLAVRGYYNFGPGPAAAIARASDGAIMSDTVSLTASQYKANAIVPGVTTVGQWRAGVIKQVGASAAGAPVLLTPS